MKNVTNKHLLRMKELMGNKKPITENISNSSIELVKKSPNGKTYGVVKENKKYFIKESTDGQNFDFIGGVANKTKNQYHSYEEAVRRLNIMFEGVGTDILSSDIIEEKRFVLKSKKSKSSGGEKEADSFDFGGGDEGSSDEGGDFDFGGGDTEEGGDDFDFGGGDEGEDTGDDTEEGGDDFDFGGDEETEDSGDDIDLNSDEDLGDDDPIKSIQKMTGKLGQKLRDTEDKSSDIMKWVAKSVLSALDLEQMDSDDKKDLIRSIKKPKDDGSDEEMDFMDDEEVAVEDDTVVWDELSPEERQNIVSSRYGNSSEEKPMMDWEEEIDDSYDYLNDGPFTRGTNNQTMMFPPEEVYNDYMDDEEMYGPGDGNVKDDEVLLDGDTYPYVEEDTDYMSTYSKNVKRSVKTSGKKINNPELGKYLNKLQNKLGGTDKVSVDDHRVVGEFGYVEVTPSGYMLHKEGSKFGKKFSFDQLGDIKKEISSTDYMDDDFYGSFDNGAGWYDRNDKKFEMKDFEDGSAEWEEKTFVDFDTLQNSGYSQGKQSSDTENRWGMNKQTFDYYSKNGQNPFKIRKKRVVDYDATSNMFDLANEDYMNDSYDEYYDETRMMPQTAPSRPSTTPAPTTKPGKPGTDKPTPSKRPFTPPPHITPGEEPAPKAGTKKVGSKFKTLDEFGTEQAMDYMGDRYGNMYNESKKAIKEAYMDVVDMAKQNGLLVKRRKTTNESVYLSLFKGNKIVSEVRINANGNVDMSNDSFDEEPVDLYSEFDEVLGMNTPRNPAPAPARPSTRPEPTTKPGKPGTDKPSPSKRPFTPPPHITPGEEPAPKARNRY